MENYLDSTKVATPKRPTRWRARRIFPRPALSRYERIRRRSACTWTDRERVFLELSDLLDAYPNDFAQGLQDLYEARGTA